MIKSWIKEDDSELFLQGYYHNNIPYGNKKSIVEINLIYKYSVYQKYHAFVVINVFHH